MTLTRFVLVVGAVLTLAAAPARAQGVQTGTIRGTVTSTDGLSVPNATVAIHSTALQGDQTTTTTASGDYVFRGLPPGAYTLTFSTSGLATLEREAEVPLGGVAEVNVALGVAPIEVSVDVSAQVSPILASPAVGGNFRHDEIEALATPRTLSGIATIAPAVTENSPTTAPTQGQSPLVINGALSYDNVFMLNGVDVNDNVLAYPQNLFIEDAIQETQVLTSGISAEYGRFSGGVVNAITKSGGDIFSGSYRLNLANDAWSTETPFERDNGVKRISRTNASHEATLGGPILRDRLWFFVAGRYQNSESSNTLPITGLQYTAKDDNKRGEVKVTATIAPGQTAQVSFVDDPRTITNQANWTGSLSTIDPAALSDKKRPNHLFGANYKGVAGAKTFLQAQYSEMKFSTNLGGGISKAIVDSPFININFDQQYNAPTFDASDPDGRNNRQLTGSASYFTGRHEIKAGYEWFRSQRTGGNSQSATGYIFYADYVADASGAPILDGNGRIQPVFAPGGSAIFKYIANPDAVLNIDTNSLYAQDHWRVSDRVSLDLGVRFEHVSSSATDTTSGIDASRAVPRLAAAFDADGTGRYVFHATYAHYSGRYDEALIGSNSPVGNPIEIDGIYKGPAGQGLGFAPGLDPNNYNYNNVYASFPSANVKFADGVHSPLTKEVTLSAGAAPNGRLSGQATYVHRRTSDLIEDFVSLANGTTHVVQPGVDLTLTNRVFRNSDIPKREYDGMVFQAQAAPRTHLKVNGAWTLQLKNDGNYEGESSGQIVASPIGDYPEIFSEALNFPTGHLASFQRSKVDVWGIYDMSWGRFGNATVSALWRYNSARVYSLAAKISGVVTPAQAAALAAAGYPDAPQSQVVFYDAPGSERFAGYAVVDTSLNWELPLHKTLRPWVKIDVFNLLNDQKLINWNTSIKPDAASPANAMGIPTGFVKSASFGQPVGNTSFPTPFAGQTGGRTLRVALGVRF